MFETERLLVEEITRILEHEPDRLPKSIRHRNMKVLKEVDLGYGVADIVIALYDSLDYCRTVFLDQTQVKILSVVENYPGITKDTIQAKTKTSSRLLSKCIQVLERENFIRIENNSLCYSNSYVKPLKNSIAIEAKLKNWKRALKQAYRYKWFSDVSYVCLPSTNINPAVSNIDHFKQLKVGLISVSKEDGFKIIYNPRPAKPICNEMNILLNEWFLTEMCTF